MILTSLIAGCCVLLADTATTVRVPVAPAETLSVTIEGSGEPVVLIPGLFGSAFTFRHVAPMLAARGYRTIIIEPLGIGASSRTKGADYSLSAQAHRIAASLDSLKTGPALVVAHSLGSAMAFRLAYRRPELVRGVLSLEGGPTQDAGTPEFRRALRFAPLIRLIHGVGIVRHTVHRMLVDASGDTTWVTPDLVRRYTAEAALDLGGTLRVYRAIAAAREPDTLATHLSEIRCPVWLLVGTAPHDGDVGHDEIQVLEQRIPAFSLDSVSGAGHFLQEEQPAVVVAALQGLSRQTDGVRAAPHSEQR